MSKKQKNKIKLVVALVVAVFALLVAIVPQLTLTAEQIAEEGFIFKAHDFFVKIKDNIMDYYVVYGLLISVLAFLYFFYKKRK